MNIFELQENAAAMFGDGAAVSLDGDCLRRAELVCDGATQWHAVCHYVYDSAWVTVNESRRKVSIQPHRVLGKAVDIENMLGSTSSYKVDEGRIKGLKRAFADEAPTAQAQMDELCALTKMSQADIQGLMDAILPHAIITLEEEMVTLVQMLRTADPNFETELQAWCDANNADPVKVRARAEALAA